MAKKKIELFIQVRNQKEFYHILRSNADRLICADVYSKAFGSCQVLDRLFTTIKLDWSDGQIVLLKVPSDDIDVLRRFRDQSQPVYMFIMNMKVTKVFRGVDNIKFAEVAKKELQHFKQEQQGYIVERPVYDLDEPTPDEIAWLNSRSIEKQQEEETLLARRAARQEERKRHRAQLLTPHLLDLNFVLFWPHCYHAHHELYERWDANNVIMVGREELQLSEDMAYDVLYAGDAPLNEASLNKLLSAPALAICFRLLDDDKHFVSLVRKILYEEIPAYDDSKSAEEQLPPKTAYDRYKTYSPTRDQIIQLRREEGQRRKEEIKESRARRLSEMQRLARQAIEDATKAKEIERERLKLELLKVGNLAALEELAAQPQDHDVGIIVPEGLSDVEEEEIEFEDEDEYFPPSGLEIPGFYSPPNDVAKANGLVILFSKIVAERVLPQPEFLPPHILVMLEINKRFKAIEAIAPYKEAIIHMGIFQGSLYKSKHIAYTVKQYETLDNASRNRDQTRLVFMLSVKVDIPLLCLMDLNPVYVSRDHIFGEEECAAMFPVDYGDDYNEFEDFQ